MRVGVQRAVERHARRRGARPRRRQRDAQDRVGAEPRLLLGAVDGDQLGVELALARERPADERLAELAVHGADGAEDAEAAEARAAVAELGGLHRAGRAARGDVGRGDRPVVERQVDLHRGQPTAVEHLASAQVRDYGTHTTTFSPVCCCQALGQVVDGFGEVRAEEVLGALGVAGAHRRDQLLVLGGDLRGALVVLPELREAEQDLGLHRGVGAGQARRAASRR